MKVSQPGELWREYYKGDELSWISPSKMSGESIQRHARSEWIQKLIEPTDLRPSSSGPLLEVGCGAGLCTLSLAVLGFQVHAFDYNIEALDFAKKLESKAREAKPSLKAEFYVDNLLNIQTGTGTFNLVFSHAVMEYFLDEQERRRAYSEMVRVARSGGWVAVIVQHTGHPFHGLWRWLGWPGYINQPLVRRCTPDSLAHELKEAGLVDVRVDGIYPWHAFFFWPPWLRRVRWLKDMTYLIGRFLDKFVPLPRFLRRKLALQIVAVGKKP